MTKTNKTYLAAIPAVILLAVLLVFLNSQNSSGHTETTNTYQQAEIAPETQEIQVNTIEETKTIGEVAAKTLEISENKCRGCGKCAMIDPEHFEISGRFATVISNENLESAKLQSAINICPEGAITLS